MKALPIAITAVVGLGVGALLITSKQTKRHETVVAMAAAKRAPGPSDHLKEPELAKYIAKSASSSDKRVQDEVGRARLRMAFMATHRKDFSGARKQLLTAAREYRGSGVMDADYGGVPDQAAYQAAVCLIAEGKRADARKELLAFMRNRALSPLVHAASVRLDRLNGGQPDEEGRGLLQAAIAKQEKRIRFETSVCGPKAIAYTLPLLGKPTRDYKELAKICGTDDMGTTIEGMRRGFLESGVETFGIEVNRADLDKVPIPFLILEADHYVVATERSAQALKIFDPRDATERRMPLPPRTEAKFSMTVLCTAVPVLNEDQP